MVEALYSIPGKEIARFLSNDMRPLNFEEKEGFLHMKSILKRPVALLFALAIALSLAACGNNETDTPSSAGESADAPYELQMEISQEDWDANRQYIELDTGITMSYVEMGDPDGPDLILQHGMTDNSRSWSLVASYFTEAGYHVYMPDLRGHGYTDKPDTGMYTINDYATDLAAFMDAKGIESADLVGHSLGSMTMQAFMFAYPERCEHVVLVSSTYCVADGAEGDVSMYDMAVNLGPDEHPDDAFMAGWYTNPNPVDEDFLSREMAESQQLDATAWRCITAGSGAVNLAPLYPYFDDSIPVLIMHGTADTFFGAEAQQQLCAALPFADYLEYDGIGHNIQWEIPEEFAADVLEFIAA